MKSIMIIFISLLIYSTEICSQPVTWEWANSLGGNTSGENKIGLAKDDMGNIYITGDFTGTRSFGSFTLAATGYSEVFVAKYNNTGTALWAVKAGANFSSANAGGLTISGSELYVTGRFSNVINCGGVIQNSFGQYDAFLMKLNPATGACIWLEKAGGINEDRGNAVTPAAGGGVFICGSFSSMATFGSISLNSGSSSNRDIFAAKYNSDGSCAWAVKAGGADIDNALAIRQAPNGDVFVTGSYSGTATFGTSTTITSSGADDFYIAKYSSAGVLSWVRTGGGIGTEIGKGLGVDGQSDAYVAGLHYDSASFGNINIYDNGAGNAFIGKYSNSGNTLWMKSGGGFVHDIANDLSTDYLGNTYVTGFQAGNANFGSVTIAGSNDAFVVKYDYQGNPRWGAKVGGANNAYGGAILADASGFCYAAGYFFNTATAGNLPALNSPPGDFGVYLVRLGGGTLSVTESKDLPFAAYPNPANDIIYLDLKKITDPFFTVEIFHIDGKLVAQEQIKHSQTLNTYNLDVSKLANGNYFLKVSCSLGEFSKSILIDHR